MSKVVGIDLGTTNSLVAYVENGDAADGDVAKAAKVPTALLEEVFALNEELDEVRELRTGGAAPEVWRARLERARAPIEAQRAEHEDEVGRLSARWDALGDVHSTDRGEAAAILTALRERVLERNYIGNLLEGIERELGERLEARDQG